MSEERFNVTPFTKSRKKEIISTSKLQPKKMLADEQMVKVVVKCISSKESVTDYFSNKVGASDLKTITRSKINRIFKLDGKTINSKDLPFEDDTLLRFNDERIKNIFSIYGFEFDDEEIIKKRVTTVGMSSGKTKGDLLRIFVRFVNGEVNVLLFDPHHLVATKKFKKRFAESKDLQRVCLSKLSKLSIYD